MGRNELARKFIQKFIRTGLPIGVGLTLASCVDKQVIPPTEPPSIHQGAPSFTPSATLEPYDQDTKEPAIKPKMEIRLDNLKIPTLFENFTDSEINLTAMHYIYYGFDRGTPLVRFSHKLNNQDRIFTLTEKPLIKSRAMLFMPARGPVPKVFGDIQSIEKSSGLLIDSKVGYALSYVQEQEKREGRSDIFSDPDNEFTANFVTQVCRQTVDVNVSKINGEPVEDVIEKEIAERIVCNSMGRARAARMINVSYKEYRGFMEGFRIVGTEEPLVLDEASYNSFPTLGPIIKSPSIS